MRAFPALAAKTDRIAQTPYKSASTPLAMTNHSTVFMRFFPSDGSTTEPRTGWKLIPIRPLRLGPKGRRTLPKVGRESNWKRARSVHVGADQADRAIIVLKR